MKIFLQIALTVFLFGLSGYEVHTQESDALVIYTQGPLDPHPFRGYEIEFFSDGMIKRIRQFRLSGEANPYDFWKSSNGYITFISEYVTEREGNMIVQYQMGSAGSKKAVSTFVIVDKENIRFNQHETSKEYIYNIKISGNIKTILQDADGKDIQSINYSDKEITMLFQRTSVREITRFDGMTLTKLFNERGSTHWESEISFDGKNVYTIVAPDLYDEVPFAEKVTILVPRIRFFSRDAIVLNRFLTFIIRSKEPTYLLPFVSRQLIP